MTEPVRISPQQAVKEINEESALLVCAYDDDQKFNRLHLKGAISLAGFKSKLPSLSKDKEIIFYCA